MRRWAALPAAVLCPTLLSLLLSGCTGAHGGGFERDVVVRFALPPGDFTPPAAEVAAVRSHCPGGPQVRPVALPPAEAAPSVRLNGVRYDVRGADEATIASLQGCLQRQAGVISADLEDGDS